MFMVYWTVAEAAADEDGHTRTSPHARQFESNDMLAAMAFMEQLRTRQRAGERLCFITMSSENPDSVGHPGVDVTGPGYNWKKRRR